VSVPVNDALHYAFDSRGFPMVVHCREREHALIFRDCDDCQRIEPFGVGSWKWRMCGEHRAIAAKLLHGFVLSAFLDVATSRTSP